eukprot:12454636-Ditylum_brightwellii.AAC.1
MEEMTKTLQQEAVDDIYIQQLKNKYTGYMGVGAKYLMDHLLDFYGKITPADVVNNNLKFQDDIYMGRPIDTYFTTIDNCVQYNSDAKVPCTSKQIMVNAKMPLRKHACIGNNCKSGDTSQQQIRSGIILKKATSCTPNFHQANMTEHVMGEVSDTIEQLAMTATTDKNTMEELAQTNKELVKINKILIKKLQEVKTMQMAILNMHKEISNKKPTTPLCVYLNNRQVTWNPYGYCWLCRY